MAYIEKLMEYPPSTLLMIVILLIFAIPSIVEQFQKLLALFGRPTKAKIDKINQENRCESSIKRLDTLEEQMKINVQASIRHDEKLQKSIENLTAVLEKHVITDDERTVAMLRSTIWRMHSEFMTKGYVTKDGLKTFKECVNVYRSAGGNDIVHDKLEPEVLDLEVKD